MSGDDKSLRRLATDLAKASMPYWPFVAPAPKMGCCSTHCERWQECRSPNDCCGNYPLPASVAVRMKDGMPKTSIKESDNG
jgi:hypothetical protein